MVVRLASLKVAADRIDDLIRLYRAHLRPVHQQASGLRHHYWLVDRRSGEVRIIGFWESQEAIDAAKPTLEPARERFWSKLQGTPTLEVYEVADQF
jgi:quinol monooxygenase YgiN